MLAPSVAVQLSRTTTLTAGKLRTLIFPQAIAIPCLPMEGESGKLRPRQVKSTSSSAELDERKRSRFLSHS
jgi:hypothetical protein